MSTMRGVITVAALACALGMAGCASGAPAASTSPSAGVSTSPSAGTSASPSSPGMGPSASASPLGTWGQSGEGRPNATFTADGRVAGTDGCNHFSGTWEESGGTITVGAIASTLMACQDVDAWLAKMTTVRVDGDTLHVYKGSTELGTLARQ